MTTVRSVDEQLASIGVKFRYFGRPEVGELAKLLMPDERIVHCSNGFYQGGFAVLCATNHRLLLVDKRLLFLNLEDIRYETIIETNLAVRLFDAILTLHIGSRKLAFRSFSEARMRALCIYIQNTITEIRNTQQPNQMDEAHHIARTSADPEDSLIPPFVRPRMLSKYYR